MGIVVQKYGGSSVADATGIKRVAQRIVDTRKAGQRRRRGRLRDGRHHRRAARPRRAGDAAAAAARARHAAHRRRADLDGAAGDGDRPARPQGAVVHRLPGRRDHRLRARQGQDHRHHARAGSRTPSQAGAIAIVAGFQGVSQDTKDITTLGRGASDTTAVALAAALGAEVCEIYSDVDGVFTADPRIVPTARKLDRVSTEEMLEMAASGAKILHLRCVEYARRYDMPVHVRSSFSQKEGTWIVPDSRGRRDGTGHHRRSRPRPERGQDHRRRRARQGRRGGPDLRGARRRPRSTSTWSCRTSRPPRPACTDISFTLPREDGQTRDGRAGPDPGRGRLRQAALRRPDRQGVADRRRHALAPRHHRQVLLRARLRRRQHRDDLHLRDPDLGDRRRGARSTTPSSATHTAFDLDADEVEAVVYGGTGR